MCFNAVNVNVGKHVFACISHHFNHDVNRRRIAQELTMSVTILPEHDKVLKRVALLKMLETL